MSSPTSSSPTSPTINSQSFDPTLFHEYISTKSPRIHQISPSTSPSTPLYTITRNPPLSRSKPTLVLHAGSDKTSLTAGIVKTHISNGGYFTIGVGNPDLPIEEGGIKGERMVWERLQRTEKWRYRRYRFEYERDGERKVFMWRRTNNRWGNRLRDMELRVGEEEGGDLVAVWRGSEAFNVRRGSMFVKKVGEESEEERKWVVMVLLTGFAIIEAYVRRQ